MLRPDFTTCMKSYPVPSDFHWGVATAAYQIEGGWNEGGKGPSNWDTFCQIPGMIKNGESGKVADDFYHRYLEDVQMMKQMGVKNFRMSISWPRVLPVGTKDFPNWQGVQFYHDLIDALLDAAIEPWVTLYHWDLPQALDGKTNQDGWLNPNIPQLFNDYAEFCFQNFGSKVKHWITINEPQSIAWLGYGAGVNSPGRCSPYVMERCEEIGGGGDTPTEPYIVSRNIILAHALAYRTYHEKYAVEGGEVGLDINSDFFEPWDPTNPDDIEAVQIKV